jgi:hypothetical protein
MALVPQLRRNRITFRSRRRAQSHTAPRPVHSSGGVTTSIVGLGSHVWPVSDDPITDRRKSLVQLSASGRRLRSANYGKQ